MHFKTYNMPLPGLKPKEWFVVVAGGRDFSDYGVVKSALDHLFLRASQVVIVSGHARGADLLGERYARENGLGLIEVPAKWMNSDGSINRAAGFIRNGEMAKIANSAVIFPGGRGTEDMKQRMLRLGHLVVEVGVPPAP